MAAELGFVVIGEIAEDTGETEVIVNSASELRWRRLVLRLHRLRFKQRCWGVLGGFFQTFPASLRDRLRAIH
jgi:hypothetical protein